MPEPGDSHEIVDAESLANAPLVDEATALLADSWERPHATLIEALPRIEHALVVRRDAELLGFCGWRTHEVQDDQGQRWSFAYIGLGSVSDRIKSRGGAKRVVFPAIAHAWSELATRYPDRPVERRWVWTRTGSIVSYLGLRKRYPPLHPAPDGAVPSMFEPVLDPLRRCFGHGPAPAGTGRWVLPAIATARFCAAERERLAAIAQREVLTAMGVEERRGDRLMMIFRP